jgi:3-oxoacyl-[acyl-carrier protein] reductase
VATCDVSRAEAVDDLAARIAQESAPPDILVNNAGVSSQIVPILKSDPARWTQTMMINVVGPYLMSRRFAPAMVENGWGRIVNVSSAASLAPPFGLGSDYPLSKVALNHFTRQLAAELADSGVTVNAIHPGEVQSEMWRAIRDDAHLRGPEGEGARGWAKLVEDTGGDPPEKAAALVLRLCDPSDAEPATGKFHWIEEGLGKPIPTWD